MTIVEVVSKMVFTQNCHTERSRSVTIQKKNASATLGMTVTGYF